MGFITLGPVMFIHFAIALINLICMVVGIKNTDKEKRLKYIMFMLLTALVLSAVAFVLSGYIHAGSDISPFLLILRCTLGEPFALLLLVTVIFFFSYKKSEKILQRALITGSSLSITTGCIGIWTYIDNMAALFNITISY